VGVLLQKFVAPLACLSALSCLAGAPSPFGSSGTGHAPADEVALDLPFGLEAFATSKRAASFAYEPLNGDVNAAALEPRALRDTLDLSFAGWVTPWLSLHADAIFMSTRWVRGGNVPNTPHLLEQAGATLYPARGWNASLFVNFLSTSAATPDDGVRGASASFVNARINHDLSKHTRLSLDVMNIFDKRVDGIDAFASSRLWTDPDAAESMLFNPAESRGIRLRLRKTF
jgi:hypothetical protein